MSDLPKNNPFDSIVAWNPFSGEAHPWIISLKEQIHDKFQRGSVIKAFQVALDQLISNGAFEVLNSIFADFQSEFTESDNLDGIISNQYKSMLDALTSDAENLDYLRLAHLHICRRWGDCIPQRNKIEAQLNENLSKFASCHIHAVSCLQEAKLFYAKAQLMNDVARVESKIREILTNSDQFKPSFIPISKELSDNLENVHLGRLGIWLRRDNSEKFTWLCHDQFFLRPVLSKSIDAVAENDHGFFEANADFLRASGIVKVVPVSPSDGRTGSDFKASYTDRSRFDAYESYMQFKLTSLTKPIQEYLLESQGNDQVWEVVARTFAQHFSDDLQLVQAFGQGLSLWVQKFPHYALPIWIPYFEGFLRSALRDTKGVNVVNPTPRDGLDDFILFDGLLNKASSYYPESTVLYWRYLFSTKDGLGLNLRNNFCHGILPFDALNSNRLALQVFCAYAFLLCPSKNIAQQQAAK